jgi:hypothetical protein
MFTPPEGSEGGEEEVTTSINTIVLYDGLFNCLSGPSLSALESLTRAEAS